MHEGKILYELILFLINFTITVTNLVYISVFLSAPFFFSFKKTICSHQTVLN